MITKEDLLKFENAQLMEDIKELNDALILVRKERDELARKVINLRRRAASKGKEK